MNKLSIVIGSQNSEQTIRACLEALIPQAAGHPVEIIVADGSHDDGTAALVAAEFPQVKFVQCDSHLLMPQLWQAGLDQASGDIIAFTIAQCIPAADWLAQIVAAHQGEAAGVGGPIEGPTAGSGRDWALYFARFNAFLPPRENGLSGGSVRPVEDIPGDNGSYKRAALDQCRESMSGGFWETLVHVCLHQQGHHLLWDPAVRVHFAPGGSLRSAAATRMQHGRHYGATRPGNTPTGRLFRILTGPLIPFVLLNRIAGRVRRTRPDWTPHLLRALPALFVLVAAWSIGEVAGYLLNRP